jgi:hypothetical protein
MNERPTDRLVDMIRRSRHQERRDTVDLGPLSTYEAVTRQMVEDLGREIGDLKRRIDTLFYVVISAIVIDVLGRVFAGGWP